MSKESIKTPLQIGRHQISGLWRYALPDDFQFFNFPEEKKATCDNCPKVCDGYDPVVRCCTYNPRIPNFLLGFALKDQSTTQLIQAMVADQFATPEGMQQTTKQAQRSYSEYAENLFGKKGQTSCRFQNKKNGYCGIYPYRNSVCSSFFCYVDHGEDSRQFWERFESVAGQIETALSLWCMSELGVSIENYFKVFEKFSGDLSKTCPADEACWSPEFLMELWGEWAGKEADFYMKAADLIEGEKENLFEIACNTKLLMPTVYDRALFASMDEAGQQEMEAHGAVDGIPVAIGDLWYQLQLAHRNLQQARGS